MARVVGGIPHQEHQPPAHAFGQRQRRARQRPANALALTLGIDRQRSQQQGRVPAEPHRPIADRPDQPAAGAGDVAELGQRRETVAVAVGDLVPAVGAEGAVEQGLDARAVLGSLGSDQQHGDGPMA